MKFAFTLSYLLHKLNERLQTTTKVTLYSYIILRPKYIVQDTPNFIEGCDLSQISLKSFSVLLRGAVSGLYVSNGLH